ncbi:MAG: NADH-quinone oxidoreductase subunit N [Phycisphaerales bacterium]
MSDKLAQLGPEIALFVATCIVMLVGQWKTQRVRQLCAPLCAFALVIAGGLAVNAPTPTDALYPELARFAKTLVAGVGLLLLALMPGVVDRDIEALATKNESSYRPIYANRAEFFSFFLFSLTGLMLVADADDLIWLFLALELTSLPTYIMVTISTQRTRSHEAGVKYFFLGALGAAIFLYGFALLYGATGTTSLPEIAAAFGSDGLSTLGVAGLLIALLGVSFKVAAVPMHFYTPDVYQGAASPISAFLAFVPKTAGFLAIFLLVGTVGWHFDGGRLPLPLHVTLWVVAALTMTVGNVLATLQDSVKRMLAYSSVAHSGYMLVGVLAGPGPDFARSGLAAVLFYLLCYGVMNTGVFGVLAALERKTGEEVDSFDDVRGLVKTNPVLGWTVVICTLSLLGFPPLLGFVGKFGLFTAGISNGLLPLVIILGINSAIAAFYYLRLVATVYLDPRRAQDGDVRTAPFPTRPMGAVIAGIGVIVLLVFAQPLMDASFEASEPATIPAAHAPAHASDDPSPKPAAVSLAD